MTRTLFPLFRNALREDSMEEIIDLDREALGRLYKLSKMHDMAHLIGYAMKKSGIKTDDDIQNAFEQAMNTAAFRYVKINYDLNALSNALEEAQIPFIPLKGSVIRKYYNEPWLRTSCDIDILVHKSDLEKVKKVFVDTLHYEYISAWNYEVSYHTPSKTHIELHHTLSDDNQQADKVLEEVWQHAAPMENHTYHHEMSDAMYYLYHMVHMAKHFVNGGCGIRPFLDIWVLNHNCSFDRQKRYELLERAGLLPFAKEAEQLSEAWFTPSPHTPLSEQLERFILNGGSYGSVENRVAVQQAITGSKLSYLLSRIFLPYDQLKLTYPNLVKRKWLFPFYQVKRWFRLFYKGRLKRSVSEAKKTSAVTTAENDQTTQLLTALGLK